MDELKDLKQINVERGEMPIEWFDESPPPEIPDEGYFKVRCDGRHHIAVKIEPKLYFPPPPKSLKKRVRNEVLDEHIQAAVADNCKGAVLRERVIQEVKEQHPEIEEPEVAVAERIGEKYINLRNRRRRFLRKAYLNRWNYFVTITYDDKKMNEVVFRKKLKNCLRNLASNHKWRYMGVFERGEEDDRLHFHAVMYIPQGEMVGALYERKDFSTKLGTIRITHPSTFFEKKYGRNDFDEIDQNILRLGNAFRYLLKYIGKQNERIIYSRGIKEHIIMHLENKDIACGMLNTDNSFVLFDGKVDWERDVMRFKNTQASIFDADCPDSI